MSSKNPLHFTLCGSPGPWDQYNPYKVTSDVGIQKLLLEINRYPSRPQDITEEIGLTLEAIKDHIQILSKAGLVEEDRKGIRPTFAVFTNADIECLLEWSDEVSEELASQIQSSMSEVRDFIHRIGMDDYVEMEYLTTVAFGLDFGGLEVLEEEELIITSRPMPGNRAYIFTGVERGVYDPRKAWMWGHTDTISGVFYCTHGMIPEEGPRDALPDLFWVSNDKERRKMNQLGPNLSEIFGLKLKSRKLHVKEIPGDLATDRAVDFLREIGYVSIEREELKFLIPVLRNGDEMRVLGKKLVQGILTSVIAPLLDIVKDIYAKTTPGQNGVDFSEGFNFLYHLLFERSVDLILRKGIIKSPAIRTDSAVYACCVIPNYQR